MAGEWHNVALGELVEIFDGPHATPAKTSSGPIFLGISNLAQGRLNLSETEYLSEEDYQRWTRRVTPTAGDVVFSYETRLGEAAFLPPDLRCCLGRRMGLLRSKPGKVDQRFLLYAYLGPQFQETLRARTIHGSTVDRIPLIDMPEFPIHIPHDLREQRTIAYILGTLDDKIELNRRMNETLEGMARALFKSWFVDFDPVRAKIQGRTPPGMDPETAALFPDSFQDSELGPIPKGWCVGTLGEYFDLTMGQSPPGETYNENGEGMLFFQGRADFAFRYPTPRVYCTSPTRFANSGDTLVSVRAPVGDINMALDPCCIGRGVAAVRHKSGSRSYTFYSTHSLSDAFAGFEKDGTVFGCINKTDFLGLKWIAPASALVQQFERVCQSVDQRIESIVRESLTLAALRDTLLPKLLSGELRVNDVERVVGGES